MGMEANVLDIVFEKPSSLERTEATTAFGPYEVVKFNESGTEHKFASNDLFISSTELKEPLPIDIRNINGEKAPIPVGSTVAHVDFMPNGFAYYDESNKFAALALGVKGISNYFYAIAEQGVRADYLYGNTNEKMASTAKMLGFTVLDVPDTQKGLKNMKFIYAPVEDVYKATTKILSENPEKMKSLLARYSSETDWTKTDYAEERKNLFYNEWIFKQPEIFETP